MAHADPYTIQWTVRHISEGGTVTFRNDTCFLLPLDKCGRVMPDAAHAEVPRRIRDAAAACTDLYVMSHGWNSTPTTAIRLYRDTLGGLAREAAERCWVVPTDEGTWKVAGSSMPYKPLFVGIVWPSILFADGWGQYMASWSVIQDALGVKVQLTRGMTVSNNVPPQPSSMAPPLPAEVDELATAMGATEKQRASLVLSSYHLESTEKQHTVAAASTMVELLKYRTTGLEVATCVDASPGSAAGSESTTASIPDAVDVFEVLDVDGKGFARLVTTAMSNIRSDLEDLPETRSDFDPTSTTVWDIIRAGTVRMMKERAESVGGSGVLSDLLLALRNPALQVHILGHSFGCKVVLQALNVANSRRTDASSLVHSLSLIQPAVSRWVFSPNPPKYKLSFLKPTPGAHVNVVHDNLVAHPVLVAFSQTDWLLKSLYPLGFPFTVDVGRVVAATEHVESPGAISPAAALGAYGSPLNLPHVTSVDIGDVDADYSTLVGAARVVGVRGDWIHTACSQDKYKGWLYPEFFNMLHCFMHGTFP